MNKQIKSLLVAFFCFAVAGCGSGQRGTSVKRIAYNWVHIQPYRRDAKGKLLEAPRWSEPLPINGAELDSFTVYGQSDDSIWMSAPGQPGHETFVKAKLGSWSPKAGYGLSFKLIGSYERTDEEGRGLLFCFYVADNWSELMQVLYTNPGNVNGVVLFSEDSVNRVEKESIAVE